MKLVGLNILDFSKIESSESRQKVKAKSVSDKSTKQSGLNDETIKSGDDLTFEYEEGVSHDEPNTVEKGMSHYSTISAYSNIIILVAQDLMKYVQNVEGMLKTPDLDRKLLKSKS